MNVEISHIEDAEALASLRARAMRESLEKLGRYDPTRVRERFLSKFDPASTKKILINNELIGFYVLLDKPDHYYLDHLYIDPEHQGNKVGSKILIDIIGYAKSRNKAIRLGALKESRSNNFYLSHGFTKTHEEEFDNFYIYKHS